MQGPSPATTVVAPTDRMVSIARARTSAPSPRHPTCTAPWTPSGDPNATDAQSAVNTTSANPFPLAMTASPSGGASSGSDTQSTAPSGTGESAITTVAAWT